MCLSFVAHFVCCMKFTDECLADQLEMLLSLGLLSQLIAYLSCPYKLDIIANNIASAAMQACAIAQYLNDQTDYGQAEHAVMTTQLSQ